MHSLCTQANAKGFDVYSDDVSGTFSEEAAIAQCMVKSTQEELTMEIFQNIRLDNLSELIQDCEESVNMNDADWEIRTTLSIANFLRHWPLQKLTWEEFTIVQDNISRIFNLAAVRKSTKEMLLRNDLLKVLKNPWPDMTMIPWYLVYTNINSALVTLGFVSILDDTTSVLHTVFLKNSSEIIRLCSESLTARSRYSDGVIREKRHSTNVVFALRRELKGVFGISLAMRRIGRNRSK